MATRNIGANPMKAWLLAMPTPTSADTAHRRDSFRSRRYSNRLRIANAKTRRSIISPVKAVACCQKVNWKANNPTARTGGTEASGMVRSAMSENSRIRSS